jgi:hypothetical protein
MRPGRIKHKARARHRKIAVTCAGVSALTVMGGTAAFATEGGSWHPHDGDASLDNGGSATADVNQYQGVFTQQLAHANTGANHVIGIVANVNLGHQDCDTYLDGGNVDKSEDNNTAGNNGGNCTNDGTATNDGTGTASVNTGDASAPNSATANVSQSNAGNAAANNTANDNNVTADDGNASLSNGGDAYLWVNQQSSVDTWQGASANSGHNTAISGVVGINVGSQTGTTSVTGGDVHWSDDGNTAGNTGGNASNTSNASNTGNGTASITTGNASAANSSNTTVTQSNTGSATSTNTASGNTVTSD